MKGMTENRRWRAVSHVSCMVLMGLALASAIWPADFIRRSGYEPLSAAARHKLAKKWKAAQQPRPTGFPRESHEFFVEKRVGRKGAAVPVERYRQALDQIQDMPQYSTRLHREFPPASSQPGIRTALGTWDSLGPGNVGGRTRGLVIDPTTPDTMYAAGVAGGVWKTSTAGDSWTPVTDLIANLAVSALAMDPSNSSVLYAGTGEGIFNADAVRGVGIFKTSDGGTSWTHLASTENADFHYVNDIVVSPNNANRLYAATRTGVWRSIDMGTSWTRVLDPAVNGGCLDLAIRTDQVVDFMFAACGMARPGTTVTGAVYRNIDAGGGGTWVAVLSEAGMGRTSLAIAPSDQEVIYALTASTIPGTFEAGLHAVFRSTSGGGSGSWQARVRNTDPKKLNTVLLSNPVVAFATECGFSITPGFLNQGWYDNVIAVDPLNSDRVWVGGIDIFRSDDGGANWGLGSYWWTQTTPTARAHADYHTIVFHPGFNAIDNRIMYVGNDGGIYRTDNARASVASATIAACSPTFTGMVWVELNNNYGVTQFYHGLPYPDGTTYFGGTQDNGTIRGNDVDGPEAWAQIDGGDSGYVAINPADTSVLYSTHPRGAINRSTGGGPFIPATTGITESSDNFLFIAPLMMDPNNPQRLWTGGKMAWRTTNAATSWTPASAPLAGSGSVSAIAIAPSNSNVVLIGMSDGFIHRTSSGLSSNAGTSWAFSLPRAGFVSSLAFDPTHENIVYATYATFGDNHIWKSMDGGGTWSALDGTGTVAIPDVPVHSLAIDPSNTSILYIGTDVGVFVSLDGGASWLVENTGFANVITETVTIGHSGADVYIFAFTHGRGAWRVLATPTGPPPPSGSTFGGWVEVPGLGATLSGPEMLFFQGNRWIFVRGTDQHIYWNAKIDEIWTGWAEVPSHGVTPDSPGAVVFNGVLYVFVRGIDNLIYVNTYDGSLWSGWTVLPSLGATLSGPSTAVWNGQLYVFVHGTDHRIYVNTYDGSSWSGWSEVPGFGVTFHAPRAVVFDGVLYLVVRGVDGRIYDTLLTLAGWTGWAEVFGSGFTAARLGASVFDGGLDYFMQGTDLRIYHNRLSGPGGTWSGWSEVPGFGLSLAGPASGADDATQCVVVQGVDLRIYINEKAN